MSKSDTYVKRTEEFLTKLQETMPFELVDVEFVKEAGEYYLRAYCDKEGGIGVDDCADISRALSDWLDQGILNCLQQSLLANIFFFLQNVQRFH